MKNKLQSQNSDFNQESNTYINTDKSIIEKCAQYILNLHAETNKNNKDKIYNLLKF